MDFRPIELNMLPQLRPYYEAFGENSCQHSFVSSYCMSGKYGDQVCVRDGFLYTLRSLRGNEKERVYLFPLGDTGNADAAREAVNLVLEDARANGARVRFETVTERAADFLRAHFADRFVLTEERDFAEYLYTHDKLALLPGHEMASKRYDIHTFERDYGDRCEIRCIETREQIEEIARFQEWWMKEKTEHEEDVQLECEHESILLGLEHFFELGLSGITVRIDGEMAGYAYGARLSDTGYDVMIEKGNRAFTDIYRVLNRDLVRLCCEGIAYINREEDLGEEGLRRAKLSYKPDILLKKFIAREEASA